MYFKKLSINLELDFITQNSIIYVLIAWVVIVVIAKGLKLERFGFEIKAYSLTYKNRNVNDTLLKVLNRTKRGIRVFADVSVVAGFLMMGFAFWFLINNISNFFVAQDDFSELTVLIPGVTLTSSASFSPYIIGIIRGFRKTPINFSLIKERAGFLANSYLQTLSGTLGGSLDKIIIAPLFGFGLLGNYSLGLQFLTLLTLLPTAVGKYLIPQDSSGIENKKIKKIIILFSVGLAILGFTLGPLVVSSVFPKFIEAEEVIKIVSISVIPSTVAMTYQSKFLGREKSRQVLISSGIWTGTQIIGIIILGQIYGVNGIAASLVLGATASAIYAIIADKYISKISND